MMDIMVLIVAILIVMAVVMFWRRCYCGEDDGAFVMSMVVMLVEVGWG
jgi:hypothetical protein